jgi:hypothetical protein
MTDTGDGRRHQHRGHYVSARWQPERGQRREHLDARRIKPGFLPGLAQRRVLRTAVLRVERATGKRRLAGMAAHIVRPLDDQQIGPVGSLAEQQ